MRSISILSSNKDNRWREITSRQTKIGKTNKIKILGKTIRGGETIRGPTMIIIRSHILWRKTTYNFMKRKRSLQWVRLWWLQGTSATQALIRTAVEAPLTRLKMMYLINKSEDFTRAKPLAEPTNEHISHFFKVMSAIFQILGQTHFWQHYNFLSSITFY